MAVIELEDLWKFYGDYPAIRSLSLTLDQGACCALLGRNGAGKTTLLRVLSGLTPFQRGTVRVLAHSPRSSEARREIGFLGHGIGVYDDLTARENLRFFAGAAGLTGIDEIIRRWLDRVALAQVGDIPVRQFSRGMRQRLALARTFLSSPRLLLLDEPFTSLDDRAIAMLSELLVEARQRGASIILSTHQLREALAVASHVALLENGKLRFAGERTTEMLDDPAFLYRQHTELGAA
jgi:heme ABC exporter ATP-binding subunit CcmA